MPPGFRPESTEENTGNIVPDKDTGIRINEATGQLEIRGSYGDWYVVDPETGGPIPNTDIRPCYNIDSG
jgi:hypothetical protein